MIVLALDTSTSACAACVFDTEADGELAREVRIVGTGQAAMLSKVVDVVLQRAGVGYYGIGLVVATIGPGSFTGVRIAIAAARGYSLAIGVPGVGVSVLRALAEAARPGWPGRAVMAVTDAGRGEFHLGAIDAEGREVIAPSAAGLEAARDVARRLDAVLIGTGAPVLAASQAFDIAGVPTHPDIGIVARLAAAGPQHVPLTPLYLRAPDARPQAGFALPRQT